MSELIAYLCWILQRNLALITIENNLSFSSAAQARWMWFFWFDAKSWTSVMLDGRFRSCQRAGCGRKWHFLPLMWKNSDRNAITSVTRICSALLCGFDENDRSSGKASYAGLKSPSPEISRKHVRVLRVPQNLMPICRAISELFVVPAVRADLSRLPGVEFNFLELIHIRQARQFISLKSATIDTWTWHSLSRHSASSKNHLDLCGSKNARFHLFSQLEINSVQSPR
jgi:hypothetical protein